MKGSNLYNKIKLYVKHEQARKICNSLESTTHFQNMHTQRQHQMSEKALLHWEEVWSEIYVQASNYLHKDWMLEKRVSSHKTLLNDAS